MENPAQPPVATMVEFEFFGEEETKPPIRGVPMTLFIEGDKVGAMDDSGNRWKVPLKDVQEVLRRVG